MSLNKSQASRVKILISKSFVHAVPVAVAKKSNHATKMDWRASAPELPLTTCRDLALGPRYLFRAWAKCFKAQTAFWGFWTRRNGRCFGRCFRRCLSACWLFGGLRNACWLFGRHRAARKKLLGPAIPETRAAKLTRNKTISWLHR